jgi:ribose transport system ATP-binding protein
MTDIRKEFPGVVALDGVDFQVEAGEVHALLGENGAGKSTLIKILAGLYTPDSGEIIFHGERLTGMTPQKVLARGIGFIHQERVHIPYFTVGQMLFLGHEPRKSNGLIDWQRLYEEADAALASTLGAHIDSRLPMQHLSVSEMQLVDITKILMTEPSLIVFDEPTASLSEEEVERLFAVIRNLKERGVTVIYVSHRLDEIFKICDRATVLKDGKRVGTVDVKKSSPDQIVTMMVGRKLEEQFPKVETKIGKPVLEVTNLTRGNAVRDVSFTVREGEILGVYGLVGAGRTETMRLVFGADPKDAGTIRVDGREVDIKSPGDAVRAGVALVPEDRRGQGVLVDMSVRENTTLASLKSFSSRGFLKLGFEGSAVAGFIKRLAIRTPSSSQLVRYLSGGNQQKVVLAKWMASKARVFIFDQPTIGVDVGAKAEIYRLMGDLAAEGAAVVLVSSEIPEIRGLSDRVLVMYKGRISAELSRDEATAEKLLFYAMGGGAVDA